MMIGYSTVFNAKVLDKVMEKKRMQVEGQMPVKEVATSKLVSTAAIKSPVMGSKAHDNMEHSRTFIADGDQVYAIQYRKLIFRFFSKNNLDKEFLEAIGCKSSSIVKCCWS